MAQPNYESKWWGYIYDQMMRADLQEIVDANQRFYQANLRNVTGPVLECACGTGIFLLALLAAGQDMHGLDISPSMLATLKRKAVHAEHIKKVSGRKTDVLDAEWIADLLCHGLLRGSFIPSAQQRAWRDLTPGTPRVRTRSVDERTSEAGALRARLQKLLEDANIKLASVRVPWGRDIMGVSGRTILRQLIAGQTDPATLADLAQGRLREKRVALVQALQGRLTSHHRFMLIEHLTHIDYLDEAINRLDEEIEEQMRPF